MFKVRELFFVDDPAKPGWAVALEPDRADRPPLEVGTELIAGHRTWRVVELHDAPAGLVACHLDGPPLNPGRVLRPRSELMEEPEFMDQARLLVRLSRAMRAIDGPGLRAFIARQHFDFLPAGSVASFLNNTRLADAFEHGATPEQLEAWARHLGIGGEG